MGPHCSFYQVRRLCDVSARLGRLNFPESSFLCVSAQGLQEASPGAAGAEVKHQTLAAQVSCPHLAYLRDMEQGWPNTALLF
jgi:hypothetical protein